MKSQLDITVAVVCHAGYAQFLPECIASVDAQTNPAADKILMLDGDFEIVTPAGWRVERMKAGSPNPLRNAALALCKTEWIVFFDADDAMPPDYLRHCRQNIKKATWRVAVIYPRILYCDGNLKPCNLIEQPEWNEDTAKNPRGISTESCWRVEAVRAVGGFSTAQVRYDEYTLLLCLSRVGWIAQKGTGLILVRSHGQGQRSSHVTSEITRQALWTSRSVAIVTLFAGRADLLGQWFEFLMHADLPPRKSLHLIDNSDSREFSKRLRACADKLIDAGIFEAVTYIKTGKPDAADRRADSRMANVANLYNRILPQITEEMTLFLEDDVRPPLDGVRLLAGSLSQTERIGAVSGAYRSARNPQMICGGHLPGEWVFTPFASIPHFPIKFGFIPGGFTLYFTPVLKRCLPFRNWKTESGRISWDSHVSERIRAQGYALLMHGGVRCDHLAPEVISYLSENPIETVEPLRDFKPVTEPECFEVKEGPRQLADMLEIAAKNPRAIFKMVA